MLITLLDVTGPSDATKGVLIIFDIFGYYPQTLQGADILSSSDAKQKYQVFMPDWFKGEPCPIEMCVYRPGHPIIVVIWPLTR